MCRRKESVAAHCGPWGGGIPGGAPGDKKKGGQTHTDAVGHRVHMVN